ncbi:MAG: GMC oxidoreductase, partial [Acidobacteriaceae bacterium]
GSGDALEVTGVVDSETKPTLKKVVRKLASLSTALGSVPLSPLLKIGEPGRGYHSGGSFPMSTHPSEGQSDIFGRPAGFARVHAVDSTVFPSIAATTITLTAMANAWRIGSMLKQYA